MGAGASANQLELVNKFSDSPQEQCAAHAKGKRWGELEAVLTLCTQAHEASNDSPADDPDEASTADARATIAKYLYRDDGGVLDKNTAPPAELMKALTLVGCCMPCECAGPYSVGTYHKNDTGDLRSFSTIEARESWHARMVAELPPPSAGGWGDFDPTKHDADFALQYGTAGRDIRTVQALHTKCDALRKEHEVLYNEVVEAAAAAEPEAFEQLQAVASSSGAKLRQPTSCAGGPLALYRGALLVLPALWAVGVDIAGGRASDMSWSIKKPERFFKKALEKYDNEYQFVTDVARISLVFKTVADIVAAAARLRDPYRAVVLKNRFVDKADGGYCDVLSQIEMPGQICEVQLHLATVFDLKSEAGHKCYKWFRRFADIGDRGPKDEQGQLHGDQCEQIQINGDSYKGACVHGEQRGKGRYIFADGDVMEGVFGEGGEVVGSYTSVNGSRFEGRIVNAMWQGEGTYTTANGSTRTGTFVDGHLAKGRWTFGSKRRNSTVMQVVQKPPTKAAAAAAKSDFGPPPGTVFEGAFERGTCTLTGPGCSMTYADGRYTAGTFEGGVLHGIGGTLRLVRPDGKAQEKTGTFVRNKLVEGKFVDGDNVREGTFDAESGQLVQGKFVCAQTTPPTVMEGAFDPKSGQPHGQNVRTQADGMVIDGEWQLGAPWNADVKAPGGDKVVCRIEEGKKVAV